MKKPSSMFMFGMRCVRCDYEIIAPHKTELLDDNVIRHLWHCCRCKAYFKILSALSGQGPVSEGVDDERRCLSAVEWNLMLEHCPVLERFDGIVLELRWALGEALALHQLPSAH